jgi:hypothetical protein
MSKPSSAQVTVRGFWKGTHVHMLAIKGLLFKRDMETLAFMKLQEAKLKKIPKTKIGAEAIRQLDRMEEVLCKYAADCPKGEVDSLDLLNHFGRCEAECDFLTLSHQPGVAFHRTWFVNLALVLKLKLQENDDDHGWLISAEVND